MGSRGRCNSFLRASVGAMQRNVRRPALDGDLVNFASGNDDRRSLRSEFNVTPTALRPNPLTEGPIARALFFFTLPILASNVLQSLNGSVNAIWVGHFLGEAALTATSNANTILFFLISLVFGIGMASAILVRQSIGAKNREQAKRVVGNGVAFF